MFWKTFVSQERTKTDVRIYDGDCEGMSLASLTTVQSWGSHKINGTRDLFIMQDWLITVKIPDKTIHLIRQ